MCANRNINNVSSTAGENLSMFLRQLSSSFHPALLRTGVRSTSAASSCRLPLAPHPWWSAWGFPPWPPHLLPPSQPAHHLLSGRTVRDPNFHPGNFAGSWRWFHASSGLMERPDRDRGPPHKRWKSTEEKRSVEEKERRRGGGARAGANQGGPREEQHLQTANQRCKEARKTRDGQKGGSRENSRDKDRERSGSRGALPKLKDGSARDGTPDRGRSVQEWAGRRDSQPAGGSQSRTQSPKVAKPPDSNPWFKDRAAQEQRAAGAEPRTRPPNPWMTAGAWRQPAPPAGGSAPVRAQQPLTRTRPLQRRWEAAPACSSDLQPPGVGAVFDFSVLSYNILSQDLLQDNAYLYQHCHPAVLPWDYRLPNLLAEIQQYNADILCLQEVQENHYENQIKPALEALGYQCEYKKRTGKKPDGCAIIFKTSRLSLVSSNPVEFFRPGDALLDRDNVGLVLMLRPNDGAGQSDPSDLVCVANTHLLYNPRRGDIKLAQLAILLAEISRLSRLPDGLTNPVVMCGDFNSVPWSPLYSFLTTGCLQYRGMMIGQVSGQENSPRGQRLLSVPIWSNKLGINQRCQYESSREAEQPSRPTGVEEVISDLTVEELATKTAAAFHSPRIEHSVKLQSSYQHLLMHDGRPEITTCHSRTAMTVDYILYTPNSLSSSSSLPGGRGLQLLGRLSLVGTSELEEVNGLPNHHHSSDHLPLLSRFRLQR